MFDFTPRFIVLYQLDFAGLLCMQAQPGNNNAKLNMCWALPKRKPNTVSWVDRNLLCTWTTYLNGVACLKSSSIKGWAGQNDRASVYSYAICKSSLGGNGVILNRLAVKTKDGINGIRVHGISGFAKK